MVITLLGYVYNKGPITIAESDAGADRIGTISASKASLKGPPRIDDSTDDDEDDELVIVKDGNGADKCIDIDN